MFGNWQKAVGGRGEPSTEWGRDDLRRGGRHPQERGLNEETETDLRSLAASVVVVAPEPG